MIGIYFLLLCCFIMRYTLYTQSEKAPTLIPHTHTHIYKVSGKLSEQMPFRETLELRVVVGVIKNNMPTQQHTHARPQTGMHFARGLRVDSVVCTVVYSDVCRLLLLLLSCAALRVPRAGRVCQCSPNMLIGLKAVIIIVLLHLTCPTDTTSIPSS